MTNQRKYQLNKFEKLDAYINKSNQDLELIWQSQALIIQMSLMKAYNKETNDFEADQLIQLANRAQEIQSLVENEKTKRNIE